ncbi:hypothetical protein J1N35_002405, partial [Gossypium stocksii]
MVDSTSKAYDTNTLRSELLTWLVNIIIIIIRRRRRRRRRRNRDDLRRDENGFWNEVGILFELENQKLLKVNNDRQCGYQRLMKQKKAKHFNNAKIFSQYFYMPITKAAKELNIG